VVDAKEILLAEPRGLCAGVDRAIEIVERALQKFGRPIYVRHEIVHNTFVVNDLKDKGAIFIEELDDVPPGATLVFSAHGVSRAVQEEAQARGLVARARGADGVALMVATAAGLVFVATRNETIS
jgi:4-hydroxy-3-methylbut-2-enyl diphosphate reductase